MCRIAEIDHMKRKVEHQGCLFEEDFLRRTLGAIANTADVALTELVANAWDAGGTAGRIFLPGGLGGLLAVEDEGTGVDAAEFPKKAMKLGVDRGGKQGALG